MTDVSAQAFREAAEHLRERGVIIHERGLVRYAELMDAAAVVAVESDNRLALLKTATEEVNSLRDRLDSQPHCRFPQGCDIHDTPAVCAAFWRARLAEWEDQ